MKIVYDSQIFTAQKYGGVSRYFCEIASRIAKNPEIDVLITAPMHINSYLSHVPRGIVSGFRAPNTDHFRAILGTNYLHLMMRGLGLIIGDVMLRIMKPDIIHETYFSPYRLGGSRACRVLTIYDMIHEKFSSCFSPADKTAYYKAQAAERADHIICISESTKRDAIDILGLNPDKISVVYLGFDLMKTDNEFGEKLILPTRKPFLLYVGNRGGYKNFLHLLEAYGASSQLRTEYKLLCFGGGVFSENELAVIKKLNLNANQVIHTAGDDQLLSLLYENASAFIFPSLYEGFGIPPLEAMAHDCPVVCSNTSSIPEVVGDAGEYFDPVCIESMVAAIEKVVESESYRETLIAKGRARLKHFSWEQCANETLSVYKELL